MTFSIFFLALACSCIAKAKDTSIAAQALMIVKTAVSQRRTVSLQKFFRKRYCMETKGQTNERHGTA
jgi:hypothetical protein